MSYSIISRSISQLISSINLIPPALNKAHTSLFHLNSTLLRYEKPDGPMRWMEKNKRIFPPQRPNAEPRPAYVCHVKKNFKYSPDKMWYIAILVRGMSVDEAVRQLSFVHVKGSDFAKEAILEAQELAVRQHNVEFKSNLWVAESFVGRGKYFKGIRKHTRGRFGEVEYKHCHYFIRLEEGTPPLDYYNKSVTPEQQLDKWLEQMRKRKISNSL